jgi:hypothetical protein
MGPQEDKMGVHLWLCLGCWSNPAVSLFDLLLCNCALLLLLELLTVLLLVKDPASCCANACGTVRQRLELAYFCAGRWVLGLLCVVSLPWWWCSSAVRLDQLVQAGRSRSSCFIGPWRLFDPAEVA